MLRLVIVTVALLSSPMASATPASEQNRPVNDTEQKIMHSLGCTCDTCNHEPLDECGCPQAAALRAEVKDALRGRDLSTAAAQTSAYAAVRAAFAGKYGDAVLTPLPQRKPGAVLSWLPIVIFVGGFALFLVVTRRSFARRRHQ